ncbi:hypothetical protein HDU77_006464 [Chytriomyces hyalinus]|uniref:Ubiquinol-cytochrome c reductase subunit 10 n=1 Tax=Chytriomyces confervae TaxID=246404 RepID=A0A507EHT8_9FUNG|nr:hypothetical protein HDU77_006459 [Chytriomyces hyalinus]KAJ3250665.1 hypothetical protein HDU77_006464 [Chytriomyces hyalinus]TPX52162.1 hypothetical protein CcCBS67573_g09928 [Chytriomyces confervae]TPX63361.1 hypothetical protein CcCBS67573_g08703 [Chytriomyces confervae]
MLHNQFLAVAPWLRTLAPLRNTSKAMSGAQSAVTWGAAIGLAAIWIIEPTPIARRDVLQNIPVIGVYWKNKLEKALQVD